MKNNFKLGDRIEQSDGGIATVIEWRAGSAWVVPDDKLTDDWEWTIRDTGCSLVKKNWNHNFETPNIELADHSPQPQPCKFLEIVARHFLNNSLSGISAGRDLEIGAKIAQRFFGEDDYFTQLKVVIEQTFSRSVLCVVKM